MQLRRMAGRAASKITVIGGGPIGLSTALHIAQQAGASSNIVVIERDTSYRKCSALLSAGGIRQQFSLPENVLMSKYSFNFLADLEERSREKGYEIAFRRNGYLFLGRNESDKKILEANNKTQRECGVDWTHLASKIDLETLYPWLNTEDIVVGSYSNGGGEGYFDPWAYMQAMRAEAKELGVTFINKEVNGAEVIDGADGLKVTALKVGSGETVECEHVINCAGAWSGKVFDLICEGIPGDGSRVLCKLPIVRKKRCVFSINCPGKMECSHPVPPTNTPLTVDPTGVYFRSEGSRPGHFICGVSPEDDPDIDDDSALENVDHDLFYETIWPTLAERVPAFNELKVEGFWAGFYNTNKLGHNLIIGKCPDFANLHTVGGLSGHGLQMAPAAGKVMASMLLEESDPIIDLARFGHSRLTSNDPIFETGIV